MHSTWEIKNVITTIHSTTNTSLGWYTFFQKKEKGASYETWCRCRSKEGSSSCWNVNNEWV